jgi:hypothetical protein
MECPSCHFHNMPGNHRCLKCGSRLDVAATTMAVEPPRASARAKRLRKWLPRWTQFFRPSRLRDEALAAAERNNLVRLPAGALVRMVVPGWGQWYLGNAARARNYFVPWVMLVLFGLVNWGSLLGSVALYGALCFHGISIADLLSRPARGAK